MTGVKEQKPVLFLESVFFDKILKGPAEFAAVGGVYPGHAESLFFQGLLKEVHFTGNAFQFGPARCVFAHPHQQRMTARVKVHLPALVGDHLDDADPSGGLVLGLGRKQTQGDRKRAPEYCQQHYSACHDSHLGW